MTKCALVLALACATPLASAEIWKCAGSAGVAVYQNFPCQFDSIGSAPSAAHAIASTPPPASVASPATAKHVAVGAEPKIGMTTDEVKAMWGEPLDRYEDEQINGRFLVWDYGSNRSVRFTPKRRVASVQR
jgi:hypothetical protein